MTQEEAKHIAFIVLDDAKLELDSLRNPPPGVTEYVQGKIVAARMIFEKLTNA